ncbi:MAG: adenosylcobalamin-dependent ribonucleoside-diphosphate reductase [Bacteroidales bacterium]|nr:adenosylcobalamin-dependent ribonucleoside-diphosphate reductase [Bacteroidales bacterium]
MAIQAPPATPEYHTHPIDEVKAAAKAYFHGDALAGDVWANKYALKDSEGNIYELTPDEMHHRIAREVARIERKYPNPLTEEEIFEVLKDFKYIVPQGSPMAGIGNDFQISSLSNCFVIGNKGNADSYGGIMKIDQEQVQLMKRRGGVGHDLSHLRPTGSPVKNCALTSTGVVPFMERYSNSTREVAQDGRRGALMLSISIKHPDSEAFIDAKMTQGKITNANVSVKITDEFMQCVKEGKPFIQQYPIDAPNPQFTKEVDARALWNKIIHNAWQSAEPGVLFWDTILRESIPDCYADLGFRTVSTNPCGEIPLCPYDSCRLLAINLYSYVDHPFTPEARFNSRLFAKHVGIAQRMMDDIVDLEQEKVEAIIRKIESDPEDAEVKRIELNLWKSIKDRTLQGRRTGIGITAEGDMLAALGKRYASDEAIAFSTEVQKLLAHEAYRSSVNLAEERGAFPVYNAKREENNPFINRLRAIDEDLYQKMLRVGRRNIAMLTIAPTGSVSLCTQTTSGIEPVFMVVYKRRRKVNANDKDVHVTFVDSVGNAFEEYNVFHHKFLTWLQVNGYNVEEVMHYDDEKLKELIAQSPYHLATANDIDWVNKVKMQGSMQKWVDHSISVTVNIPKETTEELVSQIYMTAWECGCKGMTIYRDGSRDGVLVAKDEKKTEKKPEEKKPENDLGIRPSDIKLNSAPQRPKELECDVVRFQNNYEKWIAFVGKLHDKPYEIFLGNADEIFLPPFVEKGLIIKEKNKGEATRYDFQYLDKGGYPVTIQGLSRMFNKEYWNYAKLISGILRHGMPINYVIELIQNLTVEEENINTWKNGIVRALKKYVPDGLKMVGKVCPECGQSTLIYQDGCMLCTNCGHSKCG